MSHSGRWPSQRHLVFGAAPKRPLEGGTKETHPREGHRPEWGTERPRCLEAFFRPVYGPLPAEGGCSPGPLALGRRTAIFLLSARFSGLWGSALAGRERTMSRRAYSEIKRIFSGSRITAAIRGGTRPKARPLNGWNGPSRRRSGRAKAQRRRKPAEAG